MQPFEAVLVCNAANAVFCAVPHLRGQRVVLNVDGIERERKKWNLIGRTYYRVSERLATWLPHCFVADARAIQKYGPPTIFRMEPKRTAPSGPTC